MNQTQHIHPTAPGNVDSCVMRELKAAATSAYLISVSGYMPAAGDASLLASRLSTSGVLRPPCTPSNCCAVPARHY